MCELEFCIRTRILAPVPISDIMRTLATVPNSDEKFLNMHPHSLEPYFLQDGPKHTYLAFSFSEGNKALSSLIAIMFIRCI
uniref:Uncharacterized protein n=1 Tax=Megaselia scalaris TaxID=36166 RepID=T1GJP8_MEGSC